MQLSINDVAGLFGVSENAVTRWVHNDNLPAELVNSQYQFHRAELLEWATLQNLKFSPGLFRDTNGGDASEPSLADALQWGGISRNVGGADKKGVLESVLDATLARLPIPPQFDRETLLHLFLSREQIGSTALGNGIAIPHPRSPIVLPTTKPAVCLCFLDNAIDYGAADGKLVDTLFVMVSPTVHDHLKLLAKLAALLSEESFRGLLRGNSTDDQIIAEAVRLEASLRTDCSISCP